MTNARPLPPAKSGHVPVNGLRYYYEIRGEGEPLLLLHGGLGTLEMFGPLLPLLGERRQLIAVELHGHGRTELGERRLWLPDIADDLDALLAALGHAQVDALGYSLGAGVALRLAAQHPGRVRRLVLASGAFAQSGYHPELLPLQAQLGAGAAEFMKDTPLYRAYAAVAPRPQDFPRLLDRVGELLRTPYDWSSDVKSLRMPVLLIYGDADMFRPEHVVEFYKLLGGGLRDAGWRREHISQNRLAILPDLTHYELVTSPELARTALPFLNGESRRQSRAAQTEGG